MTTYRPITSEELHQAQQDLYVLASWHSFTRYMQNLYGPNAYRCTYEITGEYNDEGGTAWKVTETTTYDRDDKELPYDFTTEWWKQVFAKDASYRTADDTLLKTREEFDDDEEYRWYIEEEFTDYISDARYELEVQDHNALPDEFIIDQPPQPKIGQLFVAVD